ncbi:anti-sigma factor (plasmid) [Sinorhizobium meliloti]|nr:anti-sigma factor [Sinorhizobium meliloti]
MNLRIAIGQDAIAVALKALAGPSRSRASPSASVAAAGLGSPPGLSVGQYKAVLCGLVANQLLCLFQDTVAAMIAERIFLLRSDIGAGQA